MVVHQVQDSDKRFQPLEISKVDEMMCLFFRGKVRQLLVLKVEGLQEQKQKLVPMVEMELWDRALGLLLQQVGAPKPPSFLLWVHSLIA